jgi:hypothetical protein
LPLRKDTAELLTAHLANKRPGAAAFAMPGSDKTSRMIRADLEAARKDWLDATKDSDELKRRQESAFLAYEDEEGRFADFHALRHTFLTNLARSGVHPKVAQQLARHSTITLTMDRYSHANQDGQRRAVESLPCLPPPGEHVLEAGTDGTSNGSLSVALCVAQERGFSKYSVESDGVNGSMHRKSIGAINPEKNGRNGDDKGGWGGIRTPGTVSRTAVFKTAALDHSATHPILCCRTTAA